LIIFLGIGSEVKNELEWFNLRTSCLLFDFPVELLGYKKKPPT
jgi:hypothetical protein